jgi:hypothetical protein
MEMRTRWPLRLSRALGLLSAAGLLAGVTPAPADAAAPAAPVLVEHGKLTRPAPGSVVTHGRFGVKPIHGTALAPAASSADVFVHSSAKTGVVSPTPRIYLVFWGSQWDFNDPALVANDTLNMYSSLFGSQDTWGTILSQYCEGGGIKVGATTCPRKATRVHHPRSSPFVAAFFDDAAPAPDSATHDEIAEEAFAAAAHFGNFFQGVNNNAQYVILSPSGTHPDGFPNSGFCAYHDFLNDVDGVNIAYTNLPYIPDLGDGACTTLSGRLLNGLESTATHEYAETVSDIFPGSGWLDSAGNEIGDLCNPVDTTLTLTSAFHVTRTYDMQGIWSNKISGCATHG